MSRESQRATLQSVEFSKSKKWQLTLIIANPYQGGGKYRVYYGWCTRPFFPRLNIKEKSGLATRDYITSYTDEIFQVLHAA